MSEGADQNQDTVERLQAELDELLRQHEQYTLALDAAMDPRTSLRLQRTLERLDEEIEGLQEALKGYEPHAQEIAQATSPLPADPPPAPPQPPEPAEEEFSPGPAILPEWDDDEEEPATNIYDANDASNPYATAGLRQSLSFNPIAASSSGSGFGEEDPPTVSLTPQPASGAQTSPVSPTAPVAESPTTTVTPPVQSAEGSEDPPTVTMTARPAQTPLGQPPNQPQHPFMERPAAPPGGASFSSLPPPATSWGHTEIVPPSYDTQPQASRQISPSTQPMPSSPFAAPPADAPAATPSAATSHPGSPSPFGGPPAGNAPFSSTGGYDAVGGGSGDGEWSLGSRILLALLVLLFLGGVAYILSQGP